MVRISNLLFKTIVHTPNPVACRLSDMRSELMTGGQCVWCGYGVEAKSSGRIAKVNGRHASWSCTRHPYPSNSVCGGSAGEKNILMRNTQQNSIAKGNDCMIMCINCTLQLFFQDVIKTLQYLFDECSHIPKSLYYSRPDKQVGGIVMIDCPRFWSHTLTNKKWKS